MSKKQTDFVGSLSRNKKKDKETHPTHTGTCTLHGEQYWISAYVNESRETGEKYFKLYFKPKKAKEASNGPIDAKAADPTEDDPDIPF